MSESGASGVGLKVRGSDETVFSATPMLELGAQFGNPNGTLVRAYVRGGATLFDDQDFVLLASFAGAPSGVGPFRIATNTDDVVSNVGATAPRSGSITKAASATWSSSTPPASRVPGRSDRGVGSKCG